RRVEELQVQLPVDLADDLGEQQPTGEQIVDDEDGIALGARKRQLGNDAGRSRLLRSNHGALQTGEVARDESSKKHAPRARAAPVLEDRRAPGATTKALRATERAWWPPQDDGHSRGFSRRSVPKPWSEEEDSSSRPPTPHARFLRNVTP